MAISNALLDSTRTSGHTVAALGQQLSDLGEEKFKAVYAAPALVSVGGSSHVVNEFATAYAVGNVSSSVRAKGDAEVYFVRKRPGAAFAHQIGVGRAPNVDICVRRDRISKYHAFFSHAEDGVFMVADAGSKNGTAVNGQPLASRTPKPIQAGASVSFGGEVFVFYSPDAFVDYLQQG